MATGQSVEEFMKFMKGTTFHGVRYVFDSQARTARR